MTAGGSGGLGGVRTAVGGSGGLGSVRAAAGGSGGLTAADGRPPHRFSGAGGPPPGSDGGGHLPPGSSDSDDRRGGGSGRAGSDGGEVADPATATVTATTKRPPATALGLGFFFFRFYFFWLFIFAYGRYNYPARENQMRVCHPYTKVVIFADTLLQRRLKDPYAKIIFDRTKKLLLYQCQAASCLCSLETPPLIKQTNNKKKELQTFLDRANDHIRRPKLLLRILLLTPLIFNVTLIFRFY